MSKPKEMTPERLAETRERSARATWEAVIVDRHDLLAHVDVLTERLETAERELAKVESVHQSACRKLHGQAAGWKLCEDERNAQKARADAAEAKLAEAERERDDEHAAGRYAEHDDWVRKIRSVLGSDWDGDSETVAQSVGELKAKLKALVEAIDAADKAGEEVARLHKAWNASWNNRTREVPVDDSIADAITKARDAQRVAGEKFGAALQDARGET